MMKQILTHNQNIDEHAVAEVLSKQAEYFTCDRDLGRLSDVVARLAGQQGNSIPTIEKPWVSVFAADHGFIVNDKADYSPEQTQSLINRFISGQSYLHGLVDDNPNYCIELIDVGLYAAPQALQSSQVASVAKGTHDFTQTAAMTQAQLFEAMEVGVRAAEKAEAAKSDVFIGGELAVGNPISALAMIALLSGQSVTSIIKQSQERLRHSDKQLALMLEEAMQKHAKSIQSPLEIMQYFGGFETAALCGAFLRCAQLGLPIIVDGFMATVAVWIADLVSRNNQLEACESVDKMISLGRYSIPETLFCICGEAARLLEWCYFAQGSSQWGHSLVLKTLAVDPILNVDMRFNEAVGGVTVVSLFQQLCKAHNHQTQQLGQTTLSDVEGEETDTPDCPFYVQ